MSPIHQSIDQPTVPLFTRRMDPFWEPHCLEAWWRRNRQFPLFEIHLVATLSNHPASLHHRVTSHLVSPQPTSYLTYLAIKESLLACPNHYPSIHSLVVHSSLRLPLFHGDHWGLIYWRTCYKPRRRVSSRTSWWWVVIFMSLCSDHLAMGCRSVLPKGDYRRPP